MPNSHSEKEHRREYPETYPETLLGTMLASEGLSDAFRKMLGDLSHAGLERLLLMAFEEFKGRGVRYGLEGPYPSWDPRWGFDAVEFLEKRRMLGWSTIHPMPNPRSVPYEPPSAGATGSDPDQSKGV